MWTDSSPESLEKGQRTHEEALHPPSPDGPPSPALFITGQIGAVLRPLGTDTAAVLTTQGQKAPYPLESQNQEKMRLCYR